MVGPSKEVQRARAPQAYKSVLLLGSYGVIFFDCNSSIICTYENSAAAPHRISLRTKAAQSMDEFLMGCLRVRGQARAIDITKMLGCKIMKVHSLL